MARWEINKLNIDVFDTYAPVVSWITVRLLSVSSLIFNKYTQQVDYTNTFYQASLGQTVFIEFPSESGASKIELILK